MHNPSQTLKMLIIAIIYYDDYLIICLTQKSVLFLDNSPRMQSNIQNTMW